MTGMMADQHASTSLFWFLIANNMLSAVRRKNGRSLAKRGRPHCAQSNQGCDSGPLPRLGMMKNTPIVSASVSPTASLTHRLLMAARNTSRKAGVVAQKAAPFHEGQMYGRSDSQKRRSSEFGNMYNGFSKKMGACLSMCFTETRPCSSIQPGAESDALACQWS